MDEDLQVSKIAMIIRTPTTHVNHLVEICQENVILSM